MRQLLFIRAGLGRQRARAYSACRGAVCKTCNSWALVAEGGGKFKVTEARVIEEKIASDHRPVFAVLEWVGK